MRYWFVAIWLVGCGSYPTSQLADTPACVEQGVLPDNFAVVDVENGMLRSGLVRSQEKLDCVKQAYGITGVVSLMGAMGGDDAVVAWEEDTATNLGLDFYHLQFEVFRSTDRDVIAKLYGLFEEVMTDPDQRLLVHCQHGRDRAGVAMALFKERYGLATRDEAYDEYVTNRTIWLPGLTATLNREWETPTEPARDL